MKKLITPEKIRIDFNNGLITKEESINLLESILSESEDNKERLNKYRRKLYYKNYEHEKTVRYKNFLKNKERAYKVAHEWNKKRIKEIFQELGNKCHRCGYDNIIALEVHHKDGSKRATRRTRTP